MDIDTKVVAWLISKSGVDKDIIIEPGYGARVIVDDWMIYEPAGYLWIEDIDYYIRFFEEK